jgi:hypothetical protein
MPSSPEQIAANQLAEQMEQQRRDKHKKVVNYFSDMAADMLRVWKREVDKNDLKLRDFAGWTQRWYCPLPVDADIAQLYRTEFLDQQQKIGPLSLGMRDEIVQGTFRREHHSDEIVAEVLRIVRLKIMQCMVDGVGFDIGKYVAQLGKRERREKQHRHDWVYLALGFVHNMSAKAFKHQRWIR